MKTKQNNIIDWDDHLNGKYGKKGTDTREKFEESLEAFTIGVVIP